MLGKQKEGMAAAIGNVMKIAPMVELLVGKLDAQCKLLEEIRDELKNKKLNN